MKEKLTVITVFFDPLFFNPNDVKTGFYPMTQEIMWTHIEAWRTVGCIVCVNILEVDAMRLSRNPPLDELVDGWVSMTFISLPLDEPDNIMFLEAV